MGGEGASSLAAPLRLLNDDFAKGAESSWEDDIKETGSDVVGGGGDDIFVDVGGSVVGVCAWEDQVGWWQRTSKRSWTSSRDAGFERGIFKRMPERDQWCA